MKIVLMEPLGISQETLSALSEKLTAEGHTFTAYDTVTTDTQELIERAGDAEVLIIANHPLPGARRMYQKERCRSAFAGRRSACPAAG